MCLELRSSDRISKQNLIRFTHGSQGLAVAGCLSPLRGSEKFVYVVTQGSQSLALGLVLPLLRSSHLI
jgi:hypothetical protein